MTLYFFWSQLVVIGLVMSGVSRGKGGSNPALEYTGANSTSAFDSNERNHVKQME